MKTTQCRHFSGYKPCGLSKHCTTSCPHFNVPATRLLIVHLEALGAVLRSTSLLPSIRRKYPNAHITWVTKAPADALLKNNSFVDRVLVLSVETLAILSGLEFDVAFVIDKSLAATGLLKFACVDQVRGFVSDPRSGAILPASDAATELWNLGLNDHQKFWINQKPETQLVSEALGLPYARDEYQVVLSPDELAAVAKRSAEYRMRRPFVIGLNTGASPTIDAKKLSVSGHRALIGLFKIFCPDAEIVLLGGGAEDSARNAEIAIGQDVLVSSSDRGLRDGLVSVAACDVVVSGDSLGMHMAIALKKWVVAWFGPTCSQEIDLFDRGVKIRAAVECGPCWKRSCHKEVMCYDRVDFKQIVEGARQGLQWINQTSSYKQLSLVTSSSRFRSSEI